MSKHNFMPKAEANGKIPNCTMNLSAVAWLRYRMIELLAGKCVVIINAKISVVAQCDGESAQIETQHGGLFVNVGFPVENRLILKVQS